MNEVFGIAAFRSRQQVMRFEASLRRLGLNVKVISTPRDVAVGCGLSVQFNMADYPRVRDEINTSHPGNLIGVYQVDRSGGGKPILTPLMVR